MVEEVGDLKLGDGLPEGKLQEPFYGVRMSEWVRSLRGVPWLPLYRVRGQGLYKAGGSPDRRVVSLREVLANLGCKLHRLV